MIAFQGSPRALSIVLLLGGISALGGGCKRLRERQAIRKYARGVADANAKRPALRALEPNLLGARKTEDVAKVRAFFKDRYLPAFKEYVDAVRQVATGTPTLRRVHGRYVAALERAYEAYAAYAERVTNASFTTAWGAVRRERERLKKAEEAYGRAITGYYREHDVKVAADGP